MTELLSGYTTFSFLKFSFNFQQDKCVRSFKAIIKACTHK